IIAALIAITSSWSSRFSWLAGCSTPRTRIMGRLPTFTCRSEAPLSTASFSKSLTCIVPGLRIGDYRLLSHTLSADAGCGRSPHGPMFPGRDVPSPLGANRAAVLLQPRLVLVDVREPAERLRNPAHDA